MKYTQKTRSKVDYIVDKYNRKVRRMRRSHPSYSIPPLVSKKDILRLPTLRDINKQISDLSLYLDRGASKQVELQNNFKLSAYEIDIIKRLKRRSKLYLKRQMRNMKKQGIRISGEVIKTPIEYDEMYQSLKSRYDYVSKNIFKMDKKAFERFYANLKEITSPYRDSNFKEAWFTLFDKITSIIAYNPSKAKEIRNKLNTLSTKGFIDLYNTEKLIKYVMEMYDRFTDKGYLAEDEITSIYQSIEIFYSHLDKVLEDYA